ncbi:MAG: type II toxin-antitoxin system RelE/ParE family toxin [Minisyncoccales bacterium]
MNRIKKFLLKLSKKEREKYYSIFRDIYNLDLEKYDIKKLKNKENHFRLRSGKIRIIFKRKDGSGMIINIDYRGNVY